MKEKLRRTIEIVIPLTGIIYLSTAAFSIRVRKEIGKRDDWTCQHEDCDKSFKGGWMVYASHIDTHDKSDPDYNKPETGRIHCIEHEIQFHSELLLDAIEQDDDDQIRFNESALQKLNRVDWHTWDHRKKQDEREPAVSTA